MATLYESHTTPQNTYRSCYLATWQGITFTPSIAHKITSVKLLLYRDGSPGDLTVSIRATTDDKPSGGDLCVGTTNGNTLPTGAPYEWREITLGAGANLDADTMYAIVIRALGGDTNNRVRWRMDSAGNYANGDDVKSTDSGSSWDIFVGDDSLFEDWGEPLAVGRSFGYIIG